MAEPPGRGHIVLVHGAMDRSAGMLRLSREFDDEWQVTRYDRRGYGRSRSCGGPFTLDAQVADLVDVILAAHRPHPAGGQGEALSTVGAAPVVLVGHSFGGNVVLAVTDRYPELVRAVVVYESPLTWMDWWPGTSAALQASGAWRGDPEDVAEQFMRRLIGNRRWETLPPSTRHARRAEGRALVAELDDLQASAPWSPDRIRVPVLALYGEHGRGHHRQAMHVLGELLPDCRVAEVADAHHFGVNTHPELTAGLIREFLQERR